MFCGDSFSDPHRYVKSTLQCEETSYDSGSYEVYLYFEKLKVEVEV